MCRLQGIQAVTSGGDNLPSGKHYCQASAYAILREGGQGYLITMTHIGRAKSALIAVVTIGAMLPFWQCSKPSFARLDNAGNFLGQTVRVGN